jgi:hypothetical protein
LNLGESLRVVGGTVNANVPMKNAVDANCLGDHAVLVFGEGVPMAKSDRDMVAQPEFPHKVR